MAPRVLILTQYFHPEVAATAQLRTDLALGLAEKGVEVEVITGQPSYLNSGLLSPKEEHRGVLIRRVGHLRLGRNRLMGRLANFSLVAAGAWVKSMAASKPDVVLADSTSPFIPLIARGLRAIRGLPYVFLVADVYPDLAVALGYLKHNSLIHRIWQNLYNSVYRNADQIIVLGECMKSKVQHRLKVTDGLNRLHVIHDWADGDFIKPVDKRDNRFLARHGLEGKFVVLYSGNLGLSHDFESIVEAAARLRDRTEVSFLFIGDGGKKKKLQHMAFEKGLRNVRFLPYQPLNVLPYSLSCGDVSLVTLQEGAEGLCLPSKIYPALAAGQAILALSPKDSDIVKIVENNHCGFWVRPGDIEGIVAALGRMLDEPDLIHQYKLNARRAFDEHFGRERAIQSYYTLLVGGQSN